MIESFDRSVARLIVSTTSLCRNSRDYNNDYGKRVAHWGFLPCGARPSKAMTTETKHGAALSSSLKVFVSFWNPRSRQLVFFLSPVFCIAARYSSLVSVGVKDLFRTEREDQRESTCSSTCCSLFWSHILYLQTWQIYL